MTHCRQTYTGQAHRSSFIRHGSSRCSSIGIDGRGTFVKTERNAHNWDKSGRFELLFSALLACVLFLGSLMIVPVAHAADVKREQANLFNNLGSGSFMVSPINGQKANDGHVTEEYRQLPRLTADFSLQVSGMVVQAVVTQVFINDSDEWIEGTYVFPLPSDSAVNGMTIRIGERVIKGQIKEKNTARKMFIKARQEGKKASLI